MEYADRKLCLEGARRGQSTDGKSHWTEQLEDGDSVLFLFSSSTLQVPSTQQMLVALNWQL